MMAMTIFMRSMPLRPGPAGAGFGRLHSLHPTRNFSPAAASGSENQTACQVRRRGFKRPEMKELPNGAGLLARVPPGSLAKTDQACIIFDLDATFYGKPQNSEKLKRLQSVHFFGRVVTETRLARLMPLKT